MADLFPIENLLTVKTKKSATFWIEQLNIIKEFSAEPSNLVRSIPFKPGLNVIWAEPAEREESDKNKRGKGHSAGKTTLCRLIRYALGEESYGRDVFKHRLSGHEKLGGSWIAASIIIEGTRWAIARPLYSGAHSSCMEDATTNELLSSRPKQRQHFDDFVAALEQASHQNYPITDFGTQHKEAISWLHSIQWLTRDQEAHMAGLFKWRAPESNSQSPDLPHDKAQLLAKTIMGVSNAKARDEQQKRKAYMDNKKQTVLDISFYNRVVSETLSDLKSILPSDFDHHAETGELQLSGIIEFFNNEQEKIRTRASQGIEKLELDTLAKARDEALRTETLSAAQLTKAKDELTKHQSDTKFLFRSEPPSPDDLEKHLDELPPDRAFCGVPSSQALFKCHLHREHRAKQVGLQNENTDNLEQQIEALKAEATKKEADLKKAVHVAEHNHRLALDTFHKCNKSLNKATGERELIEKTLSTELETLSGYSLASGRVNKHLDSIQKLNLTADKLDGNIRQSEDLIQRHQRASSIQEKNISQIFDAIVKYIKGDSATGKLNFTPQGIDASISEHGERDSGAYKALACILFDLTGLISRFRGLGNHPGFLLHDSPRESEMEPSLYLPIFSLMADFEDLAPDAFQYIITTTEAPPLRIKNSNKMVLTLDGAKAEGRLLKTDLG